MEMELQLDYRLRWLDFDRYGRIQPVTIFDICQDMATIHANHMGIGRDGMMEKGVIWVVVRMKYEVVGELKHFQVVRVRTWPHTQTGFSFLRDFTFSDEEGNLLVKATSEWVLMNIETRKFARMKDHYDGPYEFCEDRAFESKPRKIAMFDEGNRPTYTVTPSFIDIDLNGHVNNARYLSFVMNALNPGEEGAIRTLQIDYRHEVMPDVPLTVHTLVDGSTALLKGVREDGEVAFACAIEGQSQE